jgi:signal transduction histidine kinase
MRQLKRLGLDEGRPPALELWQAFLRVVGRSYAEAEQDRYTSERSLMISSREMRELYDALKQSSESQLAIERDKLSRSVAIHEAVLEVSTDGVLVVDQDRRVLGYNRRFAELWQLSPAVLATRNDDELLDAVLKQLADPEGFLAGVRHLYEHPSETSHDEIALRDGRTMERLSAPVVLKTGEPRGRVWFFRDVTGQRQNRLALEAAKEAAEAASRAKSVFLANMSHEIRTPLHGVLGTLQLMETTNLSDEQRGLLTAAEQSATSLFQIIGDILDLSKVEAGRVELEHLPMALRELLSSVWSSLEAGAREKGLRLELRIDESVPAWVSGDAGRLRQVLTNLLGNAIKFTSEGGVTLSAAASDEPSAVGHVRIEFCIRDTGIGIPEQAMEKLFTPFSQADSSTTRRFGGTGLGLSIARSLVELMGGRLWVTSEDGRGSEFRFTAAFPLVDAERRPSASPQPSTGAPPRFSGRALIVEDNRINQLVGKVMLEQVGFEVDLAENGEAALERLAAAPYRVVLMDCQMPVMDGYTTTREQRRREQAGGAARHCIIALTANVQPSDIEACLQSGMDDYLPKPLSKDALYLVLQKHLAR